MSLFTNAIMKGKTFPEDSLVHRLAWFHSLPRQMIYFDLCTKITYFCGMQLTDWEAHEDLIALVFAPEEIKHYIFVEEPLIPKASQDLQDEWRKIDAMQIQRDHNDLAILGKWKQHNE